MSVTGLDNDPTEPAAAASATAKAAATPEKRTAARLEAFVLLALLAILALAAYFRFAGINWDSGSHLHLLAVPIRIHAPLCRRSRRRT